MPKSKPTMTITQTKVNTKLAVAILLLAVSGSAYLVAANLIKKNTSFEIWNSGPRSEQITTGYYQKLGSFDLNSNSPDLVYLKSIKFNTKIKGNKDIRSKVNNLSLVYEYACGYGYSGSGTCSSVIAYASSLDSSGRVDFSNFNLPLYSYQNHRLVIRGDINDFDKGERKLMFYIGSNRDVYAEILKSGSDPGYGYGYQRPIYERVYPNIKKAMQGTWLTIVLGNGYGYR